MLRFLQKQGLSSDVEPALKTVGITDLARMRALGALPDAALDRLETALAGEGLDLAARLLIREGLRDCANVRA